jgi:RNA polymerase sigma factor (sigma-70 family)
VYVTDMDLLEISDPAEEPEHRLGISQMAQRLRRAIGQLNREQQVLVGLHFIDGMTLEEVMQVLDVPLGTLKSRLHRTRAQLKKLLEVEPFAAAKRVNGHELQRSPKSDTLGR